MGFVFFVRLKTCTDVEGKASHLRRIKDEMRVAPKF